MISGKLNTKYAFVLMAFLFTVVLSGCTPKTTGTVTEDVSITGQTDELTSVGEKYRGPAYTVAIMTFRNKTPSKTLGVGEAATDILRTIIGKTGMTPITLTDEEMRDQERLIELQQTGAVKVGKKDAAAGFSSIDFRISGAITAFSQSAESADYILGRSKTQIAKVQVDYALVDIQTGETLLAESGQGEYRKKTSEFLGVGSKSTMDTSLRDGALRDAMAKAMTRMIEKLNARPYTTRVLDVDGDDILIRAGTKSNLAVGTTLAVYSEGKKIVDPDTGRVIGRKQKKVGEIVIVSHVNDKMSDASVKSGSGFKTGNIVKEIK